MRLKKYVILVILSLIATACSRSPDGEAENYLNLIKDGRIDKAKELHCSLSESMELNTVNSFKVVESKSGNLKSLGFEYGDFSFTRIVSNIETNQLIPRKGYSEDGVSHSENVALKQVVIKVWNSEGYYKYRYKIQDGNQPFCGRQNSQLDPERYNRCERAKESHKASLPERKDFNTKHQCIEIFMLNSEREMETIYP